MNRFNQILSLLAASSLAASTPKTNGRPVYPYALATTKAERLAHVKRRQSNNGPKSGKAHHDLMCQKARENRGPSRKMFVARTDGGYGP